MERFIQTVALAVDTTRITQPAVADKVLLDRSAATPIAEKCRRHAGDAPPQGASSD
jgi:hypothetical protein